jgi:hypothetical protein
MDTILTETHSINHLLQFSDDNTVLWFMEGVPYVLHKGMYYWYVQNKDGKYVLVMTSHHDIRRKD